MDYDTDTIKQYGSYIQLTGITISCVNNNSNFVFHFQKSENEKLSYELKYEKREELVGIITNCMSLYAKRKFRKFKIYGSDKSSLQEFVTKKNEMHKGVDHEPIPKKDKSVRTVEQKVIENELLVIDSDKEEIEEIDIPEKGKNKSLASRRKNKQL